MKFEISTDALQRDIEELRTLSGQLKNNLRELNASMQALNQTWEGTAKTAYLAEYQEDQQQMEQLCKTVDEFIQTLVYAKGKYVNSDNSVRSAISQIRV